MAGDSTVLYLAAHRSTPVGLDALLDRFRHDETQAERRLQALLAADYRLDLCVGAIAEAGGADGAVAQTGRPHERVPLPMAPT